MRLILEQGDIEVGVWTSWARRWSARPALPPVRRTTRDRGCGGIWTRYSAGRSCGRKCRGLGVPSMGIQQVWAPWAKAQSRFTAFFEAMVIDWLKVASFAAEAAGRRLRRQTEPRGRHDPPVERGDQRQDPVGQVGQAARLRLPQPGAVPQRHQLRSGRARPLPRRPGRPHESPKRRSSNLAIGDRRQVR